MSIRSNTCIGIFTYQYIAAQKKGSSNVMTLVELAKFETLIIEMFELLEKKGVKLLQLYSVLQRMPVFDMVHAVKENTSVSDLRKKSLLETIVKLDYLLRAVDAVAETASEVNPLVFFSKNPEDIESVVSRNKISKEIVMYLTYEQKSGATIVHGYIVDKMSKITEKCSRIIETESVVDLIFKEFFSSSPFTMKTIESLRR